jgi:PKD repeat protein
MMTMNRYQKAIGIMVMCVLLSLIVQAAAAAESDSITITGFILPHSPPTAQFTADVTNGPAPLTVHFYDISTDDPDAWDWDFGDASPHDTSKNPVHTYAAGVYTVTLIASNPWGSSQMVKQNYIHSYASQNAIVFDTPGLTGTTDISFDSNLFPGTSSVIGTDLILVYPAGSQLDQLIIHPNQMDSSGTPVTGTVQYATLESKEIAGTLPGLGTEKHAFKITLNSLPDPGAVIMIDTIGGADPVDRQKFITTANSNGYILCDTCFGYEMLVSTDSKLPSSRIDSAEITMMVPAAWYNAHNTGTIRVMRIDSAGVASLLPTQFTGYDGTTATFTATSPGFSRFGIVALQASSPPPQPPTPAPTDTPGGDGGGAPPPSGEPPAGQQNPPEEPPAVNQAPQNPSQEPQGQPGPTEGSQVSHDLTAGGSLEITQGGEITQGAPITQQDFTIHTDDAKAAGATVTIAEDKSSVTIEQPGFTLTIVAENVKEGKDENNKDVITGEKITSIDLVTTPQEAVISTVGTVSASVEAGLTSLPMGAAITTTLSQEVAPDAQSAFQVAMKDEGKEITAVAYTMSITKTGIEKTEGATVRMSCPPDWVNNHGGFAAISIVRYGDDKSTDILDTHPVYDKDGNMFVDENGNMVFEAFSPKGLSIFGMVSAKASAIKQQEEPGVTIQPITNPAMFTNIGMFSWLLGIIFENPILLVVVIAIIGVIAYFGWRKRSGR